MGKYFGTDGFRGEANVELTAEHAHKIGRFLGWYFEKQNQEAGKTGPVRVAVGKDTRRSGYMLEYALVGAWPLPARRRICCTSRPRPPLRISRAKWALTAAS